MSSKAQEAARALIGCGCGLAVLGLMVPVLFFVLAVLAGGAAAVTAPPPLENEGAVSAEP